MQKIIRFVSLLLLYSLCVRAQIYPVGVVTVQKNAASLFLDEFALSSKPVVGVQLLLRDFASMNANCKLRMTLQGPAGIKLQTHYRNGAPTPLLLTAGQSFLVEGTDLAWYMDAAHLDFTGLSKSQFETDKRLPEGAYSIAFEALDYETNLALSLSSSAALYLSLSDPPLVIAPTNSAVIENTDLQNIYFSWQLSNPSVITNFSDLRYTIHLYEVNTTWNNPTNAIVNNQAILIWESTPISGNTYLYSMAEPPLQRGKRYVYTITASTVDGRARFKNQGTTAPYYFQFGYYEGDTITCLKPVDNFQFALSTPSEFVWLKPAHALPNQLVQYTLRLAVIQTGQTAATALANNTPFYLQTYLPVSNASNSKIIPPAIWMNIQRMGRYAWQVVARSGNQEVARSLPSEFTGPPAIENFIAGGFLMTITKLNAWDTLTKVASGKCKTMLNPASGQQSEFWFNNITLTSVGNNEWALVNGSIADKISAGTYTLQSQDSLSNGLADFTPDSIYVTVSGLNLSGKIHWYLPYATLNTDRECISTNTCRMALSNGSFYLNTLTFAYLQKEYRCELVDPFGFALRLSKNSSITTYQNKFYLHLNGFVQTPPNVKNSSGNACNIAFQNLATLTYTQVPANNDSEGLQLQASTQLYVKPISYVFDLSDAKSPAEFTSATWKGIYLNTAAIEFGNTPDAGKQLQLPQITTLQFTNSAQDATTAHITKEGLFLRNTVNFSPNDSLRFNAFVAKNAAFVISHSGTVLDSACVRGGIRVPFIDTLQTFPFQINFTEQGFTEGYLTKGLANHTFTFNGNGGAEQKIIIKIKRALFAAHDRLVLDVDMQWPHFDLNLQDVAGLTVWGNNNLGITVPNGKSAITYQCKAKAGNYAISVDYLGCGRNGNAYAIGASAKIVFDEEFSGEDGPPVINAYSICKNSLLTGSVTNAAVAAPSGSTGTNGSSYVSATASYTTALTANMSAAMSALGVQASDTTHNQLSLQAQNATPKPILNAAAMLQLHQVIDLLYRLKPFITTDAISDKDWRTLDRLKAALDMDVVQKAQVMNAKELLNYMLNKVVDALVGKMNNSIQGLSDKGMYKIRNGINTLVAKPVNDKIDMAFNTMQTKLKQRILPLVDESQQKLVEEALKTVFSNLKSGIKSSVSNSVEDNLIAPLYNFVQVGITSKVTRFTEAEVRKAATELITKGAQADIKLNAFVKNADTLLVSITDTIKETILSINGQTFVRTAESLVEDAIFNIDWQKITNTILNELIKKGASQVLANQVSQLFGQNAGPFASALLNTVQFDFTNLGSKLKNGEFDKIVKFDPTNIYMVTPAADVRGSLKFTKNDSVFGDCWKADVMVRLKAPKKDNPIECTASFLTGKTGGTATAYNYWYASLGVSGFSVPLTPAPVIWEGVEGFVYSHMKKVTSTKVLPDNTNKFGLGCKFYFYDQASSGKTYVFDLGAEAQFNQGGFAIELQGNASAFNTTKISGKYKGPGFVTGSGTLGYYKTPECTKIAGNFNVKLNTEPILCAGGALGLDLKSPQDWRVWLGTAQQPFGVKVLCKDFLSNTAQFEASQKGFSAALNMNVSIAARSPWLEAGNIKFRAMANIQAGYDIKTAVVWDPSFALQEASLSVWLSAAIGAEYQTPAGSSSITLAGVAMSGQLSYKSQPEAELHGSLAGSVTLVGYNLNFTTPVNYSLSKKEIIN